MDHIRPIRQDEIYEGAEIIVWEGFMDAAEIQRINDAIDRQHADDNEHHEEADDDVNQPLLDNPALGAQDQRAAVHAEDYGSDEWFAEQARHHPLATDCEIDECHICSYRDCPVHELMHYHHDGCPHCARRA